MSRTPAPRSFPGFVKDDGLFYFDVRAAFDAFVKRFVGEECEIEFRKRRTKRSDKQNRAFHAMITPWALDEGHNIEDLKDDLLEAVFGLRETVNLVTGEVKHVLAEPHTSTLNTQQFAHLMERAVEIAAGCGVILELPDEYNARKKQEAKAAAKAAKKQAA